MNSVGWLSALACKGRVLVKKILLLLVEDEALLLMGLDEALSAAGFDVLIASSGTEAVGPIKLDAARFQGIITDIRLGAGPSGWDVGDLIRKHMPGMPVVYMSGDSGQDWCLKGVVNSTMIGKPFAMEQVVRAISQLIEAQTL